MKPLYKVQLENGQAYYVYAESEKEAWSHAIELWPDIMYKDVRDVILDKPG
jgi:predicted transcriptional regulator